MRIRFEISALAAALLLSACGEGAPPPLEEIAVQDLRGAWRMVNRSADCDTQSIRFAQNGIFRVFSGNKTRKQYAGITKVALEPGRITMGVSGMDNLGRVGISGLVFSYVNDQLRLVDMKTPKGFSFLDPPADIVDANLNAYLKEMFRVQAERFAMDRCKV
jgi:hypothetical protein